MFRLLSRSTRDLVGYKQQKFLSHSSEGWDAQGKVLADAVSDESSLPRWLSLAPASQDRVRVL